MTPDTKDIVLKALHDYQGDSYPRAQRMFMGLSAYVMKQPYGNSGRTRTEVLAGHKARHEAVQHAIDEVTKIPTTGGAP